MANNNKFKKNYNDKIVKKNTEISIRNNIQPDELMDTTEIRNDVELRRENGLDYLLKQAELYSNSMKSGPKPKNGKRKATSTPIRASKIRKRRGNTTISDINEESAVKVNQFDETPSYINGEMRDYQIRALNWLITLYENGINGILADEMGLGKTLQAISMLGYLKNDEKNDGPHLIIAPNSTLQNWLNEINRFCPSLNGLILIGNKESRADILHRIKNQQDWDVCITSYEMLLIEATTLKRLRWKYVVIDEAHRIKNENTKLSKTLRKFSSENRLLLTGTPLQNNLHELWSLLNYLLPDIFASSEDFDTWFDSDNCLSGNDEIVKRLHTILRPFMLRRIKSEVEKSLLPKIELKLFVGLTPLQRETYKKVLMKDVQTINALGQASQKSINSILMELRKAANHPYLIDGVEPGPPYITNQTLVDSCGKMMVLDKLLAKLQSQGSRVVVFTQFVLVLDLLEDYLDWRDYKYCRLDGSTAFEDRARSIDEFNAPNSEKFIFILSTRAGGLGINLTTADTVIIYDSDWNPQSDFQAIDRVHRIGQKKQVRIFRLITENTVDERIVQRAEIKQRLDRIIIQQGRQVNEETVGQQKGMKRDMIRFGAEHILSSDGGDIMDVDIDQILKDGELKAAEEDKKLAQLGENELRNLTLEQASSVSVYQFEGMDFRSMSDTSESNQLYSENGRPSRAAKRKKMAYSSSFIEENDNNLLQLHRHQLYPKQLYELCEDGENLDLSYDTARKTALMEHGFPNWSDVDFDHFCDAMYKYGRKNVVSIARMIPGKTLDEVTKYHTEFWSRGRKVIEDFDDIAKTVDRTGKLLLQKSLMTANSSHDLDQSESQRIAAKLPTPEWIQSLNGSVTTVNHGTVSTATSKMPLKNAHNYIASPKPINPQSNQTIPNSSTPMKCPMLTLLEKSKAMDESFERLYQEHGISSSDTDDD